MKIISLLFIISSTALGKLVTAQPGVDTKLFVTESPKEFFHKRQTNNVGCFKKLLLIKKQYLETKLKLKNLILKKVSQTEIEKTQKEFEHYKKTYLELFETCGNCFLHEIEKKEILSTIKNEIWYLIDGSCFINLENSELLKKTYKKLYTSLLTVEQYSKESGGLSGILKYLVVNPISGKIEKEISSSPFYSFYVIKGPFLMGQQTGFAFFARNEFKYQDDQFYLTFTGDKMPPSFSWPEVFDTSVTGNINKVFLFHISSVYGFWFISSEGYIRFFLAADLGMSFDFAISTGRMIFFENLIEFMERGLKEIQ